MPGGCDGPPRPPELPLPGPHTDKTEHRHTLPHASAPAATPLSGRHPRHVVALVCDFFYPKLGGVEQHLWAVAYNLTLQGCRVVVVARQQDGLSGVHRFAAGVTVHYLPTAAVSQGVTLPTAGLCLLPALRTVFVREGVTIVHGHQAGSAMAMEALLVARAMGLQCVYTDHSMFEYTAVGAVNLNKLLQVVLCDVPRAIAVSHACKHNLATRACVPPHRITVIPNALDPCRLQPRRNQRPHEDRITVVMLSRLVHRKGVHLATQLIPAACRRVPELHFIIGGDGHMRPELEAMRSTHNLHDRVELLGAVPRCDVAKVLNRGDVFLNCSLTESFCIAVLEAASCGLFVVSTRVGGLPELLPPDMIAFAPPEPLQLADTLCNSLSRARGVNRFITHARVAALYQWPAVARRTMAVYDAVSAEPPVSMPHRLRRYLALGPVMGLLACCVFVVLMVLCAVMDLLWPEPRRYALKPPPAATNSE